MVRNVSVRMPLGAKLWNNDPDCVILREEGTEYSLQQAQALATVAALSAGSLIFSDPPGSLPPERLAILEALLPPLLPAPAVAVDLVSREIPRQLLLRLEGRSGADLLGKWQLLAVFNWDNKPKSGGCCGSSLKPLPPPPRPREDDDSNDVVPEDELLNTSREEVLFPTSDGAKTSTCLWHLFEFWTSRYTQVVGHDVIALPGDDLQPRCGNLFALRAVEPNWPQYIGSNVHISCGRELSLWEVENVDGDGKQSLSSSLKKGTHLVAFVLDVGKREMHTCTHTHINVVFVGPLFQRGVFSFKESR
eukprot:1751178-Amphidinium_carterae.1